ncbi:MAG: hypothetical protein JW395_3536 [Nitrospira sp.]|nr:hypothetical protein [Nitrospira sp.]
MNLIAYYEGDPGVEGWLSGLLPPAHKIEMRKIPQSNNSDAFVRLPSYVRDILYLDKPDLILSACVDGIHERPLLSLDFAMCTPQYQHALQRFSRMVASVTNGCPSAIVFPMNKAENSGSGTTYHRSQALEFGAVRLMDIYRTPAVIFDWPDSSGVLETDPTFSGYPPLSSPQMGLLKQFILEAISSFSSSDYLGALNRSDVVVDATHRMRARAYSGSYPTIAAPGGGATGKTSQSKLTLKPTTDVLDEVSHLSKRHHAMLKDLPPFIRNREKSLAFYPTRIVKHAGDPYVGMLAYYDIAFCRLGTHTRDRKYNLVADCRTVPMSELEDSLNQFNKNICPFRESAFNDPGFYSYHLKNGCREVKAKPLRIYGELVDFMIFGDGCLYSVG